MAAHCMQDANCLTSVLTVPSTRPAKLNNRTKEQGSITAHQKSDHDSRLLYPVQPE